MPSGERITTVVDTSALLERREQAMAPHRSQTSPYEVMPADLRRDFLTAEHLQRIRPDWQDGPTETEIFAHTRPVARTGPATT